MDLDNISDEFEGQGHRSKVTRLKNVISEGSDGWITQSQFVLTPDVMWHHSMTSRDVTVRLHDVTWPHGTTLWRHGMKSWHPLTTFGQEYWQGYVAGGRVNAQAFSFVKKVVDMSFNYFVHLTYSWVVHWSSLCPHDPSEAECAVFTALLISCRVYILRSDSGKAMWSFCSWIFHD